MSHHVRLKVATVKFHTISYFCGSYYHCNCIILRKLILLIRISANLTFVQQGTFTVQYASVCQKIFQMIRYEIFVRKSTKMLKLMLNHFLQGILWMTLSFFLQLILTEPSFQSLHISINTMIFYQNTDDGQNPLLKQCLIANFC